MTKKKNQAILSIENLGTMYRVSQWSPLKSNQKNILLELIFEQ